MPPQGDQCVFCQLIANPSQLKLIGQTDNFYAWLDINPRARGYTMIVPKEHIGLIEDFTAKQYQEAMTLTRKVVDKAKKGLDADGVSVTMNMGEAAGQMVPHAYIQVFPRFEDEETSGTPTGAIFQPHDEAKENIDSIRKKMASVDSRFGETTKEAHPDSQKFKEEEEESSGQDKKKKQESSGPLKAGPLSGGIGTGSKNSSTGGSSPAETSKSKKSEKNQNTDQSPSKAEESDKESSDEKDEVRLDGDFEAKSFEWR